MAPAKLTLQSKHRQDNLKPCLRPSLACIVIRADLRMSVKMNPDATTETELAIHTRNMHLTERTERYARRKFARLSRHLRSMSSAELELSQTSARSAGERIVAQLTITASGRSLRGQERGASAEQAIDLVTDVLDRQIRRYKTRFYRSSSARRPARSAAPEEAEAGPEADGADAGEAPAAGSVIRTKRFAMSPMRVEDAIEEMEMLSHSFFLFFNLDTRAYSVVYRRRDGDYGLLEPQLVD